MRALFSILFFLISLENGYTQKSVDSDMLKIFGYTFINIDPAYLYAGIDTGSLRVVKERLKGEKLAGDNPKNLMKRSEILVLSKSERQSLDSQLNLAQSYRWTKSLIEKCGVFQLQIVGEDVFAQRHKILKNVYQIMQPIFIRDNTICFTFYYIYCPGLCGTGGILIHRKIKDKWSPWISVARFDR